MSGISETVEGREARRIADQIERSWRGVAWHGPSLLEVLAGVDEAAATRRPIATAHSIAELLAHVSYWEWVTLQRVRGQTVEADAADYFEVPGGPWADAIPSASAVHDELVAEVKSLSDQRLRDLAPGCPYNIYFMLHGVAQHNLYHAGQIMLLKKA